MTHLVPWIAWWLLVGSLFLFFIYTAIVCYIFLPTITRVFEESPIFSPPEEPHDAAAENVRFSAADGTELQGSWLSATGGARRGVIVFCHEYLANRWSCRPYCEALRTNGYDVFTFDFRNHGESDSLSSYTPMHWASNHEVRDLDAAIAHVRSRVGDDNAWIGLLGVSRGGSTAILVAASDPGVRAVVTDGAFPTNLTQLAYMLRWAKIYIGEGLLYRLTPDWYYSLLCGIARNLAARRHGCRFPRVAKAIRKISPRPLLIIHGEKDSYIVPEIADQLFKRAGEPKEFWLVPGAKHNAAIQVASESYGRRLVEFFNAAH
jgi:pimeloyl-ACP methyl ester carboxylesterase